jgi:hypothetical protein
MSRAFNAEVAFLHVIDQDLTALTPLSMPPMPSTEEEVLERPPGPLSSESPPR